MKKIFIFILLLLPVMAKALTLNDWGYSRLEGEIALGDEPLEDTIGGIVNIALSFLGILTTLIILFGGFKWMTSYGSSDKVDEAKKLIKSGVIGLIIIVTAYALSRFVLYSLYKYTVSKPPAT